MPRSQRAVVAAALILFLVCGIGLAWTKAPWCDEGWFGSAAYHFAARNHLVIPSLVPAPDDRKWEGSDRHIFWCMPLYLVWEGSLAKGFGFSLFRLRLFSLVWGLAALLAWALVVLLVTRDRRAMLFTLLLLAADHVLLVKATDVRMDVMSAALDAMAVLAYLVYRARSLPLAVFLSQALVTLSVLTHPNGGMLALADTAVVALYYDRTRLRFLHLAPAALAWLLGAVGWGLYLSQDLPLAWLQFSGNASGRFHGVLSPLAAVRREIVLRYLDAFGGAAGASALARVKLLILAGYVAGAAACLRLRHRIGGAPLLLSLCAVHVLAMTFLEASKQGAYLAHLTPLLTVPLALALAWLWGSTPQRRAVAAAAVAVILLVQFSATAATIARGSRAEYLETVAFLRHRLAPADVLVGPTELGFGLGFDRPLIDDGRLGYYRRDRPRYIVVNGSYEELFQKYREQPDLDRHIRSVLAASHLLLHEPSMDVYAPAQD